MAGIVNYICKRCGGDGDEEDDESSVKLGNDVIDVVSKFCYLGDMLERNGDAQSAVTARIRAGWKKFKELSGVLCRRLLSLKLKGLLYKTCVRSAMCYGAECWALKKVEIKRMQAAEMRMIRMMCGKTLRDKILNVVLRKNLEVEDMDEHLRVQRLRWLGHLQRMGPERLAKKIWLENIEGNVRRGRPRKTWKELVLDDMKRKRLLIKNALDRVRWRRCCKQPVNSGLPEK